MVRPPPLENLGLSPSKILFQILQAIHHLSILRGSDGSTNDNVYMNKVTELDRWQKVASSVDNPGFTKQMHEINLKYRNSVIEANIAHYEYIIQFKLGCLSALNLTKLVMIQSLETAQNWGKKAFKKKFRQADFKKVENLAKEYTFDQKKSKNTGSDAEEIFVATPVGKKRRNSTPESSPKATNAKRSCSQSTVKTGDLNLGSRYRVFVRRKRELTGH